MTEATAGRVSEGRPLRRALALLLLSAPIGIDLGLLFVSFFVDTYFLSSYSIVAAAAVGALFSLYGLIGMILRQVAQAGAVVASRRSTAGDASVRSAQAGALANGIGLGLVAIAVSMASAFAVPGWLGLSGEAEASAKAYMLGVGPGLIFLSLKYALAGFGLSRGKTRPQMYAALASIAVNIVLNWLFLATALFGEGAAAGSFAVGLATAISYLVAAVVLGVLNGISVSQAHFLRSFTWADIKDIWIKAVPTTIEPAAIQVQFLILAGMLVASGIEILALRIYAVNIQMFVLTWSLSIAIAVQVQTARAAGMGDAAEARRTVMLGNGLGSLGAAAIALGMWAFSDQLLGLFTSDQRLIEIGKLLFALAVPTEIAKAVYNTTCWALVGRGDHNFPVLASAAILFLVGLPLAYLLCVVLSLGIVGVWIALAVDETLRAVVMLGRWLQLDKREGTADA